MDRSRGGEERESGREEESAGEKRRSSPSHLERHRQAVTPGVMSEARRDPGDPE